MLSGASITCIWCYVGSRSARLIGWFFCVKISALFNKLVCEVKAGTIVVAVGGNRRTIFSKSGIIYVTNMIRWTGVGCVVENGIDLRAISPF